MRSPLDPHADRYRIECIWKGDAAREIAHHLALRYPTGIDALELGSALAEMQTDTTCDAIIVAGARHTSSEELCDEVLRLAKARRQVGCVWLLGNGADSLADELAAILSARQQDQSTSASAPIFVTLRNEVKLPPGAVEDAIWLTSCNAFMTDYGACEHLNSTLGSSRACAGVVQATTLEALVEQVRFAADVNREHVLYARPPRSFKAFINAYRSLYAAATTRGGDASVELLQDDGRAPWLGDAWFVVAFGKEF